MRKSVFIGETAHIRRAKIGNAGNCLESLKAEQINTLTEFAAVVAACKEFDEDADEITAEQYALIKRRRVLHDRKDALAEMIDALTWEMRVGLQGAQYRQAND